MNKPLLLQELVVAKSGSREMTIEEMDATKSKKVLCEKVDFGDIIYIE
ncbi:MAG: hypothetical protein ACLSV0_04980 [Lachnospira eligens]|jgi:hypothetical protein